MLFDDGSLHLSPNHTYFHQVQGLLHITGKQLCHFYVWTPYDTELLHIERDPTWSINITKLHRFSTDVFLPYVLQNT